ncbi:glycerophosphodiester phosphodiesterase [Nocardioides sp.]|uniref:glycerophosphodiester phosphodiesterase n=1 Tax=Nocardioides sp. TaxID=35761 RepID=UPI002CE09268|nr:glycerophosphodiester phosphodiesterase family protein [Nocardioides sp.]HXH77013.1 glycerophosphodiester phosphodiesterase family protein [Nocardioides sp.]
MRFDLQAHRGGAGLHPENTLEAFAAALTLGVSTLELDVHLTSEDDVVVSHDPALADARLIRQLTRSDLPPTMPLLRDVAALLDSRGAHDVRVNLEIKYDAVLATGSAAELTTRADFVAVAVDAIRIDGLVERASVQCFDWEVLRLVRGVEPGLQLNVLASDKYLQPGMEGRSPWLGGLDIDDFALGLVEAAAGEGFDALSPIHGSPFRSGVDNPAYVPFVTADLVDEAHAAGLAVIPYVVDGPPTMAALLGLGVDGLITNHPDRLRAVLEQHGLPLPMSYPPR